MVGDDLDGIEVFNWVLLRFENVALFKAEINKQGTGIMTGFIELTITLDSYDDLAHPRKALIRADQITSVVDVSSEKYSFSAVTKVSLMQENDYQVGKSDNGEIVRARRVIYIQESYDKVKEALEAQLKTQSN